MHPPQQFVAFLFHFVFHFFNFLIVGVMLLCFFFFFLKVRASLVKPWLPPPPIQANELIIIRDEQCNDREEVDLTTTSIEDIQTIAKKE